MNGGGTPEAMSWFGRIGGAIVGGVVLGALASLLGAYLPTSIAPFRDAIVFSLPIAILIFRPDGLLTPRHAGRPVWEPCPVWVQRR